ncbi:MAG: sensor histidine kinase [Ruminiclostridium sp.]|nr:sensor histidine kinase [Ruminiclostridium sp.]
MNKYGKLFSKLYFIFEHITFGLHRKTFLLFSTMSLVLMMLLSYLIYTGVEKYIRNETNNYLDILTKTINNYIDTNVEEMKKTLLGLSAETSLKMVINGRFLNAYDKYSLEKDLSDQMDLLMGIRKYNDIYIYSEITDKLVSTNKQANISYYSQYGIKAQPWYQKVISSPTRLVLLNEFSLPIMGKTFNGFGLALKVQGEKDGGNAVMLMSSTLDYFKDILADINNDSLKFLIIVDAEGNMVYGSGTNEDKFFDIKKEQYKELINSKNDSSFIYVDNQEYLVKVNVSIKTGWKTISFVSKSRLQRPLFEAGMVTISMTGYLILAMFFVSFFLSSRITVPIRKLILLMRRVEYGDFNVLINIHSNDEIGLLGNSFNLMIDKINKLINQLIESEVLKKEAELNALQQQINPHFLYNILESINSLASICGSKEISAITVKLGRMFRYSISREQREYVSIGDEFQHLKDYIAIEQIRCENTFSVIYEIDEDIFSLLTIKFILQPIAENSIIHGLYCMKEGGALKIIGKRCGEVVYIEIQDNGIGIENEKLVKLNENIRQPSIKGTDVKSDSIGLKNVNSRIVYSYGSQYGLEIFSKEGKGTDVILKIPAIEARGEALCYTR